MKRKYLLCLLVILSLLAGCEAAVQTETSAPEVSFTTQPATLPVTEPTAAPTTEPATVPTTVPVETEPALVLQPGYYLLSSATSDGVTVYGNYIADLKCYLLINEDRTGVMSVMGSGTEFIWDEANLTSEGYPQPYTLEGDRLTVEDSGAMLVFQYHGDTLPEEYLPVYPIGFFAVSSVGRNGNISLYPTVDPEKGYIRIAEDLTGVMVFDGVTREFTMDGSCLYTETEQIPYFYSNEVYEEDFGEEPMLTVYLDGEEFISIVFRPAEDPENP